MNRAQDPTVLLGKILRIDPRGTAPDAARDPARQRAGGGAAGLGARPAQPVAVLVRPRDRRPADRRRRRRVLGGDRPAPRSARRAAPTSAGATTRACTSAAASPRSPNVVAPIHEYAHSDASDPCSITGGYVVRDPSVPELVGRYVYADYCAGWVRSLKPTAPAATDDREDVAADPDARSRLLRRGRPLPRLPARPRTARSTGWPAAHPGRRPAAPRRRCRPWRRRRTRARRRAPPSAARCAGRRCSGSARCCGRVSRRAAGPARPRLRRHGVRQRRDGAGARSALEARSPHDPVYFARGTARVSAYGEVALRLRLTNVARRALAARRQPFRAAVRLWAVVDVGRRAGRGRDHDRPAAARLAPPSQPARRSARYPARGGRARSPALGLAGPDRVDARRLPAPRRRAGARRAAARARRRRAAAAGARHHGPQRGGRDRREARERARARLPARAAAHRRHVRRLQRRHRRHRALVRRPRRRARRRPARRQGQRAGHGDARARRRDRRGRVLGRELDLVDRTPCAGSCGPSPTRTWPTSAAAWRCARADGTNQEGAYWKLEVCAARPRVGHRLDHRRQRLDLRGAPRATTPWSTRAGATTCRSRT